MLDKISWVFLTRQTAIIYFKKTTLTENEGMVAALGKINISIICGFCLFFFSSLPPLPSEDTHKAQPIPSKESSAPKVFFSISFLSSSFQIIVIK